MNLNYKLNVITNISILITFIFTIILIVDEIYNIGVFAMNYTYNYNYGTFHSNFNNIQTIEYETNRYNVYNKTDFLYKDIFNKSYFNFLMKVALTFITVLFAIAYGLYYYKIFITDMPLQCDFKTADTFIKKALKCICDKCHELIPNCTITYLISFVLIIVIPISYLIKSLSNNIDFTPTTESTLFGLIYIIIFAFLLLKYTFELYSSPIPEKIKVIVSYFIVTIVLILSGHIYKYIYKKYTDNPALNSKKDITVFNDIYKQSPPIKPSYPAKPSILSDFSYDPKNTSAEYKRQKEIVDNYYSAVKTYEKDLKYYNERYENYKKSITDILGEKVNIVNVFLNITGLNNYIHLIIIGFIIFFAVFYYYFHKDDMIYMCMIYAISIFIVMTIMNAIQYYNTYLNKYIIYEPSAHYKSDIATVNTKLNLLLDPSNGEGFYNYLTNTKDTSDDIDTSSFAINEKYINSIIRNLISGEIINNIDNNDDNNKLKIVNDNLTKFAITDDNTIAYENYEVYIGVTPSTANTFNNDFIKKISTLKRVNYYRYPVYILYLHYNNNIKYQITPNVLEYHNKLMYYKAYQLFKLIEKLEQLNYRFIIKLKDKYYTIIYDIYNNYFHNDFIKEAAYKTTIDSINSDINTIKSAPNETTLKYSELSKAFDTFINNDFNIIKFISSYDKDASKKIRIRKINLINGGFISSLFSTETIADSNSISTSITVDDNNNILIIEDVEITKKLLNKDDTSVIKYRLPYKITDNMNNEYYISETVASFTENLILIDIKNKINNQIIITSKYNSLASLNITFNYNESDKLFKTSNSAHSNIKEYPFNVKYNNANNDEDKNILINIILRTLEYNLSHIISNFEYNNLCMIYNNENTDCSIINKLNKFVTQSPNGIISKTYNTLFNSITDTTNKVHDYKLTNFFIETTPASGQREITNYMSFLIFLYNIYNYDEKKINDIIEYSVYSYYDNPSAINEYKDIYLSEKLNQIKFKIKKSNDTNLITKYLKNIYIIKFIIKLYSIFIKTIKYQLEQPQFDDKLCMSNNINKYEKEIKIYEVIHKYFTISTTTATTATAKAELTSTKKDIIKQISINCKYFFNICIYLLNSNMDKTTDLSLVGIMNSIISNYKFYNPDDLDEIKLDELKKEVSINCNYYNKYNDIDKKQLSIMKMNADIISFNFPVLAVIFLIFLGEPLFIKS